MKISSNPFSEETEDLRSQHLYLTVAVIIFFVLLMWRLWYLQVVRGAEFRAMSESNRTRVQDILPQRGLILDRNGDILVDNHPSYALAVVREDVPDIRVLTNRLAFLLNRPWAEVGSALEAISRQPAFEPVTIYSDLTRDDLVLLETHRYELPGVVVQVKPQRRYLHEKFAAHVIGYLGEITGDQLDQEKYDNYRMGDLVGQYGVEKSWEDYLHGRRGRRMVEVNAGGRVLRVIKEMPAKLGYNLHLTLDPRLQSVAQQALQGKAGALVALEVKTGEVLAMASSPVFNPNEFVQGISAKQWKALAENPLHPLENRAVSGQYPPGSTFKIVSAIAALQEGVVTPETIIPCAGGYPFGNRTFHCWKKTGHGAVNMHRAIKESCDIYFYDVGRQLGIDRLAKYSRAFGLGVPSGIGLANEKGGLVAGTDWKKQRFGVSWQPGETLSVVIGQGYNLVTPLQMAQVAAVAANGGTLYKSRLVKKITDAAGNTVKEFSPEVVRNLEVSPENWKVVQKGLYAAVNEPGGTGRRGRVDGVSVAGKTGTAQVVALKKYEGWKESELPYKYRDHAWFVAFAPADDPQIAVAVVMEHSGHGGTQAAPPAQMVLQAYFHPEESPEGAGDLEEEINDEELRD